MGFRGIKWIGERPRLLKLLVALPVAAVLLMLAVNARIVLSSRGRSFERVEEIPARRAALVLGCASQVRAGGPNLYFLHRIAAAAALYHSGKAEYLIVSGDNRHHSYDEPSAMKRALKAEGVPRERIYCDYAGFRTLDSVVRAQAIFGEDDFIVVSQRFHARRALFLARAHGMEAIALNAADVSWTLGLRLFLREQAARVKAVLDVYVLRTEPKFYGPAVPLGPPQILVNE